MPLLNMKTSTYNDTMHITKAYGNLVENSNVVKIGLGFMIVVILSNAIKALAIWCTMRESFHGLILTQGDAVASFLERPDMTTLGRCMGGKNDILKSPYTSTEKMPKPWRDQITSYYRVVLPRGLAHAYLSVKMFRLSKEIH